MVMFLETVHAEGLNHLSYIIGDDGQAAVIDPMRDCKKYVEIANHHGAQIKHIFETHRHEDFVVGSLELARRTQARIHHSDALPFKYGETVKENSRFDLGKLTLKVIETPGHTIESISIVIMDQNFGNKPVGVFTGDTLFVGDTGRTDMNAPRAEEMAGKLFYSIHNKLLSLGDQTIIYPAHGQSSMYSPDVAARTFSTIGYERVCNPCLKKSRREFIKDKLSEEHYYAPYFRKMEQLNQDGVQLVPKLPEPKPVDANAFSSSIENSDIFLLDIRSADAFAGAHIPGSLNIPIDILPLYGGWFLPYDRKIALIADRDRDIEQARIYLMRIGLDNLAQYISGGIWTWIKAGKPLSFIPATDIATLYKRIEDRENLLVLDVRSHREYENASSGKSRRIWIGELSQQIGNLPRGKKIVTLCGNGQRASIAASYLKKHESLFQDVEICLGSVTTYAAHSPKHETVSRVA